MQQLDSSHNNYKVILNSLSYKEVRFVEEMKLAFKRANMLDEREDSNTKEDDEPFQNTRKSGRDRLREVNTKSSKAKTFTKH